MSRYSDFKFSEECSDDIRLCVTAFDESFGDRVVVCEFPLDAPSDAEHARPMIDRVVALFNS